jgi:hypothetical protein
MPPHEVAPGALAIVKVCVPIPGQGLEIALCPAQDGGHLPILLSEHRGQLVQPFSQRSRRGITYLHAHAASSIGCSTVAAGAGRTAHT